MSGVTPNEFHQRYGINPKALRAYLRRRWLDHEWNGRWELNPVMVDDALTHFRLASGTRAGAAAAPTSSRGAAARPSGAPRRASPGLHLAVQQMGLAAGIPLSLGYALPWLSAQGHLNPFVQAKTAPEILEALASIHLTLGGNAAALSAKRTGAGPTPDLIHSPSGCLIEVDEVQHFTTSRRRSLDLYPRVPLGFEVKEYRSLIDLWHARGDRAFAHKTSTDFPQPGGRQAQRAYNDALRDLLAPTFTGHPVIRIPVPDRVIDASTIAGLGSVLASVN